ncbi:MAG: hypothetical protein WBG71_07930 [Leeuwenhoekiella sp.]
MTKDDKQIELMDKIVNNLDKIYDRLIDFKRKNNSSLIVMKGNKIVKMKPQ